MSTLETSITLICYRPNGEKWFRGYLEETSESEHAVHLTTSPAEAAALWGQRMLEDSTSEAPVHDWQVTLLINGRERYAQDGTNTFPEPVDALFDSIEAEARTEFLRLKALEEARKLEVARQQEAARQQQITAQAQAREDHERQEYLRLQKKFGNASI